MSENPDKSPPKKEEEVKGDSPPVSPSKAQAESAQPGAPGAEQDGQEDDQAAYLMKDDEFYKDGHVEKKLGDSSISKRNHKFYGCYGMQSYKRFNLHLLEDNVIIYVTGNTYQIFNIDTKEKKIYHGRDSDGIGSIAVHPSRKYFAVAEKGQQPNIYIYEYPSMRLYRILKKGTETLYAHIEFSKTGSKLASIGGNPDYTLTVWDWKSQRVILKAKAFSQDVYRTSFSPFTDDTLFTAGSGHIRFWRMAQTFTGLKLQGEIGKFGALDLSDVTGLAELPDGKVVCGTEQGNMVLWEGNLVKAHLVQDQETKQPLHNGMIEQVILDDDYFLSAGGDGYIKWWKFVDIDTAEADEIPEVAIFPVKEKLIQDPTTNEPAYIVNMVKGNGFWLIADGKGKIWKLVTDTMEVSEITHFHSGKISDLQVLQQQTGSITVGEDGSVKLWDFVRDKEFYSKQFIGKATCIDTLNFSEANQGRVCAVGFDNGIARVLMMANHEFTILKAFKAHDSEIVKVKFSPDQSMFVTASRNGEVFFFNISGMDDIQKYEPLCMIQLPDDSTQVNDLRWDSNSSNVLIGCQNGRVYEIRRPIPSEVDNSETFLADNIPIREWKIKMMEFQMKKNQKKDEAEEEKRKRMRLRGELPKEEEEEEEDWDPEPILACQYTTDGSGRFIITSKGLFSGYMYICDFSHERPVSAIPIPKTLCTLLSSSPTGELIGMGFENGEAQIRVSDNLNRNMSIQMHDAYGGKITAIKFDKEEKFLLTTSEDGLMMAFQIDKATIIKEGSFDPLEDVENLEYKPEEQKQEIAEENWEKMMKANQPQFAEIDEEKEGIDPNYVAQSLKLTQEINEDITDTSQYSIQQAKLRTEEDHRLKLAEEKKESVKDKIKTLRKAFKELKQRNNENEEWIRLGDDEFNIDPEYFTMLDERNQKKIEVANKEVAWNIEFHTVKLNKLRQKFYDILEFEKFTVKAINTQNYVSTFRVQQMSDFLQKSIEEFRALLEKEQDIAIGAEFEDDFDNLDANNLNVNKDESKILNPQGTTGKLLTGKVKTQINQQVQQKKTEAEKKREERKIQREERKKKIEKLEKKEAMHSGEDPEDRKKIDLALQTYGDYKLKISPSYVVPENQRVNYAKKKQQMVLLEGSIHKLKIDFNKKIQELKLRKREIVDRVKKLNVRLKEINGELGESSELFEPQIDEKVEYPEKFFDVNDQEIEQYKKDKIQRELQAAAQKKKGLMGQKKVQQVAQDDGAQKAPEMTEAEKDAEEKKANDKVLEEKKRQQVQDRKGKKAQESELFDQMKQIKKIELQYEKDQLTKEVNEMMNSFDDEIKDMQKEKYRLESDLKNAEMKLILFYEELVLLKSMESKDQELTRRLNKSRQDKSQILREIIEISKKLNDKRDKINEIKESEEQLMARFHELCPEGTDKYDDIRKFFEKITKRRKPKQRAERAEGEEGEDEEEEEEEEFEEEEEEDEDENNVVSLPQEEYKIDEIEKLRDERMELYDEKQSILQFINSLELERKKLESKEKNIKIELEETEEEIQEFQKEKLAKLNQLDVSVVLKIKQLQNLEPDQNKVDQWTSIREQEFEKKQQEAQNQSMDQSEANYDDQYRQAFEEEDYRGYFLPKDLDRSILFTRQQLLSLINRKRELDEEQINFDKEFKNLKKEHNQKKKEIKENEKVRAEKEREYNERQMLRFGNLVDLDNLEISGPSNIVLELTHKFNKQEKKCIKMIEEADAELEGTQRDLTQSIKNNTNLLNLIRQLGEEQLDLNRKLDSTNKAIFVDEDDEEKKKSLMEKEKLKKFLELQAKEIETLKQEINLYKKKGGHIYTKVTTNRRVANQID